ncbi:MAG TPA: protoporphyrinogen oxidase [Pyrinomonadaceae bacterium]|nr:protoporphyrinogen oxidase [Pyrinomonadaceae bacterium]
MNKRVCIIGGGISGLCTAYRLKKRGVDVVLLEKNDSVGGNIKTENSGGFLIEQGPNSTLASEHLFELVAELDLTSQIAYAGSTAKKRYILKNGKLQALPMKILSLIGNKSFSARAKLRLLQEPFIKSKAATPGADESISEFFARRLGREIVDYAVDPFVSGIFAGNPDCLSLKSAFPKLFELEKNYGSLLKGAIFSPKEKKSKTPKNASRTVSFKNGMQTLPDKLAENLGESVKLNVEAFEIKKAENGKFRLRTNDRDVNLKTFDCLVIATPSFVAADLIKNLDFELSERLSGIYHPPVAVVFTAFKKENIKYDLDGFGFLIPKLEGRKILGSLWNSVIFANRAPADFHLLTTFVGGARNAETAGENDENSLVKIALEELNSILGLSGEPVFAKVKKWEKAIPQYNIGYEKIIESIEDFTRQNAGIFFCSNFYRGISVGDCIKNASRTAAEIEDFLKE